MTTTMVQLLESDAIEALQSLPDCSVDSIVTDPPYGMSKAPDITEVLTHWLAGDDYEHTGSGFMQAKWDSFVPGPSVWEECLRVLKPGGHILCFASTRTVDLMGIALRLGGFEIRDELLWLYGCLSEDTEILVDGEWQPHHKVKEGSLALCYDVEHDTYAWRPIEHVFSFEFSDTAYRLVGDRTDQIVTPNHRCLIERDGRYVFEEAEEAARQRQANVPVLEDLPGLLSALPVPDQRASYKKQYMLSDLPERVDRAIARGKNATNSQPALDLSSVPETVSALTIQAAGRPSPSVFQAMPGKKGCRPATPDSPQGEGRMDGRVTTLLPREDDRAEQPSVEGRSDVLPQARELRECQVREVPFRIDGHGTQGRVRDGASSPGSQSDRPTTDTDRGSSPRGPRPNEQLTGESKTVRQQQRPQEIRASRFTTSDLVRIEPEHYDGTMWCVTVPTGAFVARRNGKVFVTGNTGFPKSQNVSKAIDKAAGAEREVIGPGQRHGSRHFGAGADDAAYGTFAGGVPPVTAPATLAAVQWDGWGSALKPAHEPILMARKPFKGTVVSNVLTHGTGALNIDASRVSGIPWSPLGPNAGGRSGGVMGKHVPHPGSDPHPGGRFPANVIMSHHPECEQTGTKSVPGTSIPKSKPTTAVRVSESTTMVKGMNTVGREQPVTGYSNDDGTEAVEDWNCHPACPIEILDQQSANASRFFYCAKASKSERNAGMPEGEKNTHPTVKPVALMRYLVKLVTPAGGVVLDPFVGSGTTAVACVLEGFGCIGIDSDQEYLDIARQRTAHAIDTRTQETP